VSPPVVAQLLSEPWAFFAVWLLGGLFALAGASAYAELGARYPRAGGDYVFVREALGPSAGFATGFMLFSCVFAGSIAKFADQGVVDVGETLEVLGAEADRKGVGHDGAPPHVDRSVVVELTGEAPADLDGPQSALEHASERALYQVLQPALDALQCHGPPCYRRPPGRHMRTRTSGPGQADPDKRTRTSGPGQADPDKRGDR